MRSKMNWLYIVFCLLAVALATKSASATGSVLNDPGEPGSVLVFPLFETGTNDATQEITQFEISVACPNGSTCTDGQDVDIRMHWVCFNSINCQERDFTLATTVNGTIRFDPDGHCYPPSNANNFFDTCGNVVPPPCREGYLIAWVVDEANGSIKFDGLVGDAVLREHATAVTAYNAIAIQAGGALATGASTNLSYGGKPPTGHLNFNGVAYKELTNTVIGSVHYDGPDPSTGTTSQTSLILLTLDTRSNLLNNPVSVNLNFYNEIEQLNSNNTIFYCGSETYLGDLGETTAFGYKGLVESTFAQKIPFLGTGDKTGNVSIVGLVLTREDLDTKHYAYPLYDNSIPLATSFWP